MGLRFVLVLAGFTLTYLGLVAKLYHVQVHKGQFYSVKAESQLKLAGLIEPVRGNIYFTDRKNGRIPAAMNKDFPFVYAIPKEIEDIQEASEILSSIIGKPKEFLLGMLGKKDDPYEPLISRASEAELKAIGEANLKGVYVDDQPARFYPLDNLGSQVLGFVSTAGAKDNRPIGQYGIERFYNKELMGTEGTLAGDVMTKSEAGGNIELTIDRNIQDRAEKIMQKLVSDYGAASGAFIVQDPDTGKILAMGGAPAFNPNSYKGSELKAFLNPTVQEVYEPGSIFKVITMAAGIDSGALTPETTYYDSGFLTLNKRTIRNWDLKAYGTVTMTEVIEHSLNTGAAFAERKTGHKNFYEYLKKFGFKEMTGVDLPGERVGSLDPLERKAVQDINFATASYGQGISVTPLQLINAVSVIANGGRLMRPYVNKEMATKEIRRVLSSESAEKVIAMMVSAVDKAEVARIPGYRVAGKTGTAQVPNFGQGGYTDQVINTYVGFAPATDPQFTILMKLDKPLGAPLAGTTVVPAFRELSEFILGYYNISPDRTRE